jgi:hypothetical protein
MDTEPCKIIVLHFIFTAPFFSLMHQTYLGEQSQQSYRIKLYDKRDDFNFPIVNFPFLSSNIPAAPAYGVYIFQ